jgi:hypothetical protein
VNMIPAGIRIAAQIRCSLSGIAQLTSLYKQGHHHRHAVNSKWDTTKHTLEN